VREKKKEKAKVEAKKIAEYKYKVGDIVRLIDGRSQGIVEKIEKKNIHINYGIFITQAPIDKIELVKAVKN
jgi:DNA mismatch repair protein MutS2